MFEYFRGRLISGFAVMHKSLEEILIPLEVMLKGKSS